MRNTRKQQVELTRKIWRIISLTAGTLLFLYLTFSLIFGENSLEKYMKLRSNKDKLFTEISQIKKQNEEIKKQITTFKNDPNFVEELARGQGLAKDGEIIFKDDNEQ